MQVDNALLGILRGYNISRCERKPNKAQYPVTLRARGELLDAGESATWIVIPLLKTVSSLGSATTIRISTGHLLLADGGNTAKNTTLCFKYLLRLYNLSIGF
jgi:hypothetical protein